MTGEKVYRNLKEYSYFVFYQYDNMADFLKTENVI